MLTLVECLLRQSWKKKRVSIKHFAHRKTKTASAEPSNFTLNYTKVVMNFELTWKANRSTSEAEGKIMFLLTNI